jgi:elongator complex protein 3
MLKIYPTLVLEGTGLHEIWKNGDFIALNDEECVDLICEIKRRLPKWVRTMRIQRDIPSGLIVAGIKKGNLGELVTERMDDEGIRCRCIRCREAGHLDYKKGIKPSRLDIEVVVYEASMGREFFISAEDLEKEVLAGYLRLRFPSKKAHRREIDSGTALVRELKVLGRALRVGEKTGEGEQHKGIGSALLERAEEIARGEGKSRLLVNSAVGTREYYKKRVYKRMGPYMGKSL